MTSFNWQVIVNVSEVLDCNHLQDCPPRAIRSDIHTLYHFYSELEI